MPVTMATTSRSPDPPVCTVVAVDLGLDQAEVARQRRELHRHGAHERDRVVPPWRHAAALAMGRAERPDAWLTGAMVKYYAGGWTVQELAAIEQELDRQGVHTRSTATTCSCTTTGRAHGRHDRGVDHRDLTCARDSVGSAAMALRRRVGWSPSLLAVLARTAAARSRRFVRRGRRRDAGPGARRRPHRRGAVRRVDGDTTRAPARRRRDDGADGDADRVGEQVAHVGDADDVRRRGEARASTTRWRATSRRSTAPRRTSPCASSSRTPTGLPPGGVRRRSGHDAGGGASASIAAGGDPSSAARAPQFHYSGVGFAVAGRLVERLAARRSSRRSSDRIAKPARHDAHPLRRHAPPALAQPLAGGVGDARPSTTTPGSCACSRHDGTVDGHTVLQPASVAEIERDQVARPRHPRRRRGADHRHPDLRARRVARRGRRRRRHRGGERQRRARLLPVDRPRARHVRDRRGRRRAARRRARGARVAAHRPDALAGRPAHRSRNSAAYPWAGSGTG